MKRALALLLGSIALGSALSTWAGTVLDTDGDLVPDPFDNCSLHPNGPNEGTNQVDSDLDGYGNRCDTDYDNSLTTTVADFSQWFGTFGTKSHGETDHDGSGTITVADYVIFLSKFHRDTAGPGAPGPSGLACASGVATACTP
ncbi:thrombospondin type 3 repeat-containing protein [Myxococcota bacterium]|nr:thrombospondin type 3 repeat-containing protein [Myxococcota bacterium]